MKKTLVISIAALLIIVALWAFLNKVDKAALVPDTKPIITITEIENSAIDAAMPMSDADIDISVSPYYENKVFCGYRIDRIKDGSPFQKSGLMTGDIITHIDGEEIKNFKQFFSAFKKVSEKPQSSIDILRTNEKKTLLVEIK